MHPAVDRLSLTPEILRLLLTGVTEEQTQRKPSPDRWSIAEVLEHLSHVEAHSFRIRLDSMLSTETPDLEPYDEKEYDAQGAYSNRDPEESLAHWEEQRDGNVELLRSLSPAQLARRGRHPQAGIVTIDNLLNQWIFHDLGHVSQITGLVRLTAFYQGIGPFGIFHKPEAS